MGGVSVTLDRQKTGFFSAPYLREGKAAIARCADQAKYQTLADIDRPEVRVVTNPGGTNERFDRARLHAAVIVVYPDNLTIFDRLAEGDADVMITDASETRFQQKLHPNVLCAIHPDEPFDFGEKAYLDGSRPRPQGLRRSMAASGDGGRRVRRALWQVVSLSSPRGGARRRTARPATKKDGRNGPSDRDPLGDPEFKACARRRRNASPPPAKCMPPPIRRTSPRRRSGAAHPAELCAAEVRAGEVRSARAERSALRQSAAEVRAGEVPCRSARPRSARGRARRECSWPNLLASARSRSARPQSAAPYRTSGARRIRRSDGSRPLRGEAGVRYACEPPYPRQPCPRHP